MKAPAIGCLLIILTSLGATQESRATNALATLHKLNGSVSWNLSTVTAADVDCDGKLDTVLLGSEKDKVAVGIVFSSPAKQPQVLTFPIRSDTQDGFCSMPKEVKVSPLVCESDGGTLPGCKAAPGCKGFSVSDSECDGFNFYWDATRGSVVWWRR